MKGKIVLSMLVVLFVIAASLGATMAWFTAEADTPENVFQAGTVSLSVEDSWFDQDGTLIEGMEVDNWNPGDCDPKEISIEYTGTKKAFLRMQIEEKWVNTSNEDDVTWQGGSATWYDRNVPNVDWKDDSDNGDNDWNADGKWVFDDGWWYYSGDDAEYTHEVDGQMLNAVSGNQDPIETISILTQVCLKGPETGNEYQGASYSIGVTFQAIQASHSDDWQWSDIDFVTGEEITD